MKRLQRVIILLGLLVVVGFCLRPPHRWEHTTYLLSRETRVPHKVEVRTEGIGHHWIWSQPGGWDETPSFRERKSHIASVDWPRLGIYVGLTVLITLAGAFVALGGGKSLKP